MSFDPLADFDAEILRFLQTAGADPSLVHLTTPPEREFGERASNVAFQMARERHQAPRQIAEEIAGRFDSQRYRFIASVEPAGAGFINFHLDYAEFVPHVLDAVGRSGQLYGRRPDSVGQRIVVEHTSVNPNKEWHIGHVRNAVLGDVLARLLRVTGNNVEVQNYIDDTGLQAAQAVLGQQDFPEVRQPGEKYDHYIGRLYVKIAGELVAEDELRRRDREGPDWESVEARLENLERLKRRVMEVMHALERGDHVPIIQAIVNAQLETAYRLGVYYDLLNWESHLVGSQLFQQAMDRLQESPRVFLANEGRYSGALVIQTGEARADGEEPKCEVLIRSSGIPTYVGKDIAYHLWKFAILPNRMRYVEYATQPNGEVLWSTALHGQRRPEARPDRVINVIGVHQSQAQEAVKEGLRAAGFPEAAVDLVHLAYGMVSTAEGKISGRKGTSVAGDAVIDEAVQVAYERVQEKRSQDLMDEEMRRIAEAVGIGAVRYFMVEYNPLREIVFNVADVVSYDGNTGLYIQYALVRMFAILRKAHSEQGVTDAIINAADGSLLCHEQEHRLIYHMALYPGVIADAARTLAVNLVAEFAFDLATIFSQFYRDCQVLSAQPVELRDARLLLVRTARDVLVNACGVLGVPVIERL